MANPFDVFDAPASSGGNPFDKFDLGSGPSQPKPKAIGQTANGDFLRQELANADWGTRNIAAFGTALSDLYQGAKQLFGKGDPQAIEENRIIKESAPVGAAVGNMAMTAIPFGLVGNSVKGAAAIGTGLGALAPVQGDNIAAGKIKNAVIGGALGAGGQAVANKVGDVISNKISDLAMLKSQRAPLTKTLNDALDAGLIVPPTNANPSFTNTLRESFGGKAATAQAASNRNAPVFDNLARRALGFADEAPLDPKTLSYARDMAYQVGYKPVENLPAINWDTPFIKAIDSLNPTSAGGAVKSAAQGQIDDLLGSLKNKNSWSGNQLVSDIRALRNQAGINFKAASTPGGNPGAQELATIQKKAADALEGLAERNIALNGGDPNAIPLLREARQYIAKSHSVEDALIEGTGSIDPRALARMTQNGRPLSGELATIGNFANSFRDAAKPRAQIASPGVSKLDAAMSSALGAIGFGAGGLPGAAAGMAVPFIVPRLARASALSSGAQNRLRDLYQLGLPARMSGGLAQYAPVGMTVLGLNAFGQ